MVGAGVVCDAVDGRVLPHDTLERLREAARAAQADAVDVVFVADGPLGDAVVLASAVARWAPGLLVGVLASLHSEPHRHPTLLARELTTLDLLCGGRAVLAFQGPFGAPEAEAIALCRAMWGQSVAASEGPHYPVAGAINRPGPAQEGGPPVALDLTGEARPEPALLELVDMVLVPAGATPLDLPKGVDVCQIQGA
jgi:alkanesulfonate monooxygenase SsuD/methylene tetrahydromethanopterin reductase-like flavin-dependent oxidoreductase (luciferase family)